MNNQISRRQFLKQAGMLGSVLLLSPSRLLSASLPAFSDQSHNFSTRQDGMVVLFQGDSITDGNRGRNADPNHIMGHGYAFSIASRLGANHPEKNLKFINRGISGNKVSDLLARWKLDCLDLNPDLLSILVGINDVDYAAQTGDTSTLEKIEINYRSLLDQAKANNPHISFVLCLPFVLPVGRVKDKEGIYDLHISRVQAIVRNLASEYRTMLVDFQQVMNDACRKAPADYWIWDGIHPTVAGHELLSREWLKVVSHQYSWMKK